MSLGAFSVVVGAAITRPQLITKSLVETIEKHEADMISSVK